METVATAKRQFGWALCYTCGYRCSYCGVWKMTYHADTVLDVARWSAAWDRIFDLYGCCKIFISGGEPSTYPGFFDLIADLSRKHRLEICTNLDWDVARLAGIADSRNITVSPTFHPLYADPSAFSDKLARIKDSLRDVRYLLYPGSFDSYLAMRDRLRERQVEIFPIPLRMVTDSKILNDAEELARIEDSFGANSELLNAWKYLTFIDSPRGKLCRSGRDFAMIRPDGHVDRCPQIEGSGLGSIFDPGFRLAAGPSLCESGHCLNPYYLGTVL